MAVIVKSDGEEQSTNKKAILGGFEGENGGRR